jgi:hypothetical protein
MTGARPNARQNVRGQLLGREITTKAAMPTSAKAIGVEVDALLQPLQKGQAGRGFVSPALLAAWPEIVGERLAGLCMPVRMKAQPKSRSRHKKPADDGAVLEVRADASIQIDLDYGQALIVERINAFFGYRAVARLRILAKADLAPSASNPSIDARPAAPSPQAQEAARDAAHKATATVKDPTLRAALDGLGASILAEDRTRR